VTGPRVLNQRTDVVSTDAIYVGRGTPYGNPYRIGRDGTREQVIAKYERWLRSQPDLVARARLVLAGKDLMCWCAPAGGVTVGAPVVCHAQILLSLVNSGRGADG